LNRIKFLRPNKDVKDVALYRSSDIFLDYTRIVYRSATDADGNYINELVDPEGKPSDWYIIGFIDESGNESFSEPQRAGRESLMDAVRALGNFSQNEITDTALNSIIQANRDSVIHRIASVAYDEELSFDSTLGLFTTDKQPILDKELDGYFSSQDVNLFYRATEDSMRQPIEFLSGSDQGFFKLSSEFSSNDLITGDWLYFKNTQRLDYNLIREAIILGSVADAFAAMISGLAGTSHSAFKFAESIKVGKVSKKSGAGSRDI